MNDLFATLPGPFHGICPSSSDKHTSIRRLSTSSRIKYSTIEQNTMILLVMGGDLGFNGL
jgi:hypothetical protein